ncbi:hypothetical protein [Hyphococcus sp.]|uniref:hypothetical protein n=1 Tax=Hyphococcus sp. TaxID=2038636 RepID=UPI0035C725B4
MSFFFTRATPDFLSSLIYKARNVDGVRKIELASFSTGPYDAVLTIDLHNNVALFTSTREGEGFDGANWNIWRADITDSEGATFGDPSLLPAPVNTIHSECCTVAGEGDSFFFSSDRAGSWDIYEATTNDDGGYEVSMLEGALNTKESTWPSADLAEESILLFSSIRKAGAGGDDIYYSILDAGMWSAGKMLGEPINKAGFEDGARVFNGSFFWSRRPKQARSPAEGELNVSNIFSIPMACANVNR